MIQCETNAISAIYERLWDLNFSLITSGEIEIDTWINHPEDDQRRGLTVIYRPPDTVIAGIMEFLQLAGRLEPNQFFYQPSSIHFTVLSLFTAREAYLAEYRRLAEFKEAVEESIRDFSAFNLRLMGLTVSRGAVMICGFPVSGSLNATRERIRENLRKRGLADGLDQRYHLITAHCTIMRFSAPLKNYTGFSRFLIQNQHREFGEFRVPRLELVKNDWYMRPENTKFIASYLLNQG